MVINMLKYLIENYINNMTINDVIMFSEKENIYLSEDEYLKIFNAIKEDWKDFILDENLVKKYLDNSFNQEKSIKIYKLFLKYQKKYSSYL